MFRAFHHYLSGNNNSIENVLTDVYVKVVLHLTIAVAKNLYEKIGTIPPVASVNRAGLIIRVTLLEECLEIIIEVSIPLIAKEGNAHVVL